MVVETPPGDHRVSSGPNCLEGDLVFPLSRELKVKVLLALTSRRGRKIDAPKMSPLQSVQYVPRSTSRVGVNYVFMCLTQG